MLGNRYEIPHFQSDFYRDKYRKLLRWLIVFVLIIFVLIAAIIYSILFKPSQTYYGNTTDGMILDMPITRGK
jgi:hypothetical protein